MTRAEAPMDLSAARVVYSGRESARELKAIELLVEEVERRAGIHWHASTEFPPPGEPVIVVGRSANVALFADRLTGTLKTAVDGRAPDRSAAGLNEASPAREGYSIESDAGARQIVVAGDDERGVLFGVGRLLRELRMRRVSVALPHPLSLVSSPAYAVRGHEIGYRDKTNSYDGWDLPQWEQYLRDLIVFGANSIQLIPPRSDDKPESVHFPRPALETIAGVSKLADEYGLDVWMWYPAIASDYTDPTTLRSALEEWGEVFRSMPRLDAVLVPGGDPGHTPPRVLFSMVAKQAQQLKAIHPSAQWWVGAEGFTHGEMAEFLTLLRDESPPWLSGVVHGAWVHSTIADFRKGVPSRYPIRNYPDITHTLSCQFPVPDWDIAYALTIGREPVNPRPLDEAAIFRYSQPGTVGFIAYSEGCSDDVNKCVWSSLAWDPQKPIIEILREYAGYFIGERYRDDFAQGLLALERNWRGPLAANAAVATTLRQFRAMESSASPWTLKNWRFLQGLYRAYYDGYVRTRLLYEKDLEERAMDVLRAAPRTGSLAALAEAQRVLQRAVTEPVAGDLRMRVFQLAEALFQSPAHMQLGTRLYQGQDEVRGANLDGIDFPLNDSPWLAERFAEIRGVGDETERQKMIDRIVDWTNPGPGGCYDDLGSSVVQPHLAAGPGYEADPAFLRTAQHRYPYRKDPRPIRKSWRGYTGPINDGPFQMIYRDLDPRAQYSVRIVYSDVDPRVKVRLTANGLEVHPWMAKPSPREPIEFPIPPRATGSGTLTLSWEREHGAGGSGVGCEISELWIRKSS